MVAKKDFWRERMAYKKRKEIKGKILCPRCERETDSVMGSCQTCGHRKYLNAGHTHNKKCHCKKCIIKREERKKNIFRIISGKSRETPKTKQK